MAIINNREIFSIKDTALTLSLANRIYPLHWPIEESDTGKVKFGDGKTAYNSLPYDVQAGSTKLNYSLQEFISLGSNTNFQGTVADTVSNLATASATIFPEGWNIKFVDGVPGETLKVADGATTLADLDWGPKTDLLTKIVGLEDLGNGTAKISSDFISDEMFTELVDRKAGMWYTEHNNASIFGLNDGAHGLSTGTELVAVPLSPSTFWGRTDKVLLRTTASTAQIYINYRSARPSFLRYIGFAMDILFCQKEVIAARKCFYGYCGNAGGAAQFTGSFNLDTSTANALFGPGYHTGDPNWSFYCGPIGETPHKLDFGVNFPAQTLDPIRVSAILLPEGTSVLVKAVRLDKTTGAILATFEGVTAKVPGNFDGMAKQLWSANDTTAVQINLEFARFWHRKGAQR